MDEVRKSTSITTFVFVTICTLGSLVSAAQVYVCRARDAEVGGPFLIGIFVPFWFGVGAVCTLTAVTIGVFKFSKREGGRSGYLVFVLPLAIGTLSLLAAVIWPTNRTLMSAVRDDDLAGVKRSLRFGVSPNASDVWGWDRLAGESALTIAAKQGNSEIARALLDAGANIEGEPGPESPLNVAASAGHQEIVTLLLDRGARIEHADEHRQTPFARAVSSGRFEVANYLLSRGAEQNINMTSILFHHSPVEKFQYLIDLGLDPNAEHSWAMYHTPLSAAVSTGQVDAVTFLLAHETDADRQTRQFAGLIQLAEQRITEMEQWLERAKAWTPDSHIAQPKVPTDAEWQQQLGPYLRIRDVLKEAKGI